LCRGARRKIWIAPTAVGSLNPSPPDGGRDFYLQGRSLDGDAKSIEKPLSRRVGFPRRLALQDPSKPSRQLRQNQSPLDRRRGGTQAVSGPTWPKKPSPAPKGFPLRRRFLPPNKELTPLAFRGRTCGALGQGRPKQPGRWSRFTTSGPKGHYHRTCNFLADSWLADNQTPGQGGVPEDHRTQGGPSPRSP